MAELVLLPLEHGHADLVHLKPASGALLALADDLIEIAFYRGLSGSGFALPIELTCADAEDAKARRSAEIRSLRILTPFIPAWFISRLAKRNDCSVRPRNVERNGHPLTLPKWPRAVPHPGGKQGKSARLRLDQPVRRHSQP